MSISEEQAKLVNSGPAMFANGIFTTQTAAGLRITFVEQNPGTESLGFRTAVYLDMPSVELLADMLMGEIQKRKAIETTGEG